MIISLDKKFNEKKGLMNFNFYSSYVKCWSLVQKCSFVTSFVCFVIIIFFLFVSLTNQLQRRAPPSLLVCQWFRFYGQFVLFRSKICRIRIVFPRVASGFFLNSKVVSGSRWTPSRSTTLLWNSIQIHTPSMELTLDPDTDDVLPESRAQTTPVILLILICWFLWSF